MNKLPNAVKWLIVLAVLGAMGVLMWKVNDRASRVEMPAPDNTWHLPQCKLDLKGYASSERRCAAFVLL